MLKKRSTAIVILVVVLIAGTLFGTHRSLMSKRNAASEIFYQGVDNDGYGIENKLDQRRDKAQNLLKLANSYSGVDREALKDAVAALDSAETASEKFDANEVLTEAVSEMDTALKAAGMSEEDADSETKLIADLESYELQLERLADDYNEQARAFNEDILGGFPAKIFGALTGVHELEEFA